MPAQEKMAYLGVVMDRNGHWVHGNNTYRVEQQHQLEEKQHENRNMV